ncbi:hypothetical protein [Scopulibacillus cellulosilyticus]|uniref:Lipoprotein n=1 Tax=Scopulibacillus cellulosilyticus TaxID=2665665 RepID=A0ABW2Q1V9_9BACL
MRATLFKSKLFILLCFTFFMTLTACSSNEHGEKSKKTSAATQSEVKKETKDSHHDDSAAANNHHSEKYKDESSSDANQDSSNAYKSKDEMSMLDFKFDNNNWKLGYKTNANGVEMYEFIPKDESIEDWKQVVTIQFFPIENLKNPSIDNYINQFLQKVNQTVRQQNGKVKTNIIDKKENDVMYEFIVTDDPSLEDQHEIGRVFLTNEGMWHIHYAIKKAPMGEEQRNQWINLLKQVKEKKGTKDAI